MEPEKCTKMLRNLREKPPATTRGYSTAKNARLGDAFVEVFEREASPVEGQSLQQKDSRSNQAGLIMVAGDFAW